MANPIEKKKKVISILLKNEINQESAAKLLSCTKRTIRNYQNRFIRYGIDGLKDKRGGNNRKLTVKEKNEIVAVKTKDIWRSARNIRDKLNLKVHSKTVRRVILKAGLGKQNKKQVKALQTFEYPYPNDLWQTDIMGKILFPNIGVLYLIATLYQIRLNTLSFRT
jgi:transposase